MQDSISLNFYIASNPDWQQNSQDGINSMTVPVVEAVLAGEDRREQHQEMWAHTPQTILLASARVPVTLIYAEGAVLDDNDLLEPPRGLAEGVEGAYLGDAVLVEGQPYADTGLSGLCGLLGGGVRVRPEGQGGDSLHVTAPHSAWSCQLQEALRTSGGGGGGK